MCSGNKNAPCEELARLMRRLHERGLTTSAGGNLSLRDESGALWVTPSRVDKGRVTAADMVCISPSGDISGRHKPTMEYRMHQAVYAADATVRAVVHAHPAALTAFSLAAPRDPWALLPELSDAFCPVARVPFAPPGSAGLAERVAAVAAGARTLLMEHHGVLTMGADLLQACHALENAERAAAILLLAARLVPAHDPVQKSAKKTPLLPETRWLPSSTPLQPQHHAMAMEIIQAGRRSYGRALFTAAAGSLSQRIGRDDFLISSATLDWPDADIRDIVHIKDGIVMSGVQPSRHAGLHRLIYQQQPHVRALATAVPPHLTAFAVTGQPLPVDACAESYLLLRNVAHLRCDTPTAVDRIAAWFTPGRVAALIDGEAALVAGASPGEVFERLEVAEHAAATWIAASALGQPRRLRRDALVSLREHGK